MWHIYTHTRSCYASKEIWILKFKRFKKSLLNFPWCHFWRSLLSAIHDAHVIEDTVRRTCRAPWGSGILFSPTHDVFLSLQFFFSCFNFKQKAWLLYAWKNYSTLHKYVKSTECKLLFYLFVQNQHLINICQMYNTTKFLHPVPFHFFNSLILENHINSFSYVELFFSLLGFTLFGADVLVF